MSDLALPIGDLYSRKLSHRDALVAADVQSSVHRIFALARGPLSEYMADMLDTRAVYKLPVRCTACGSQQYETLLRISQNTSVICVACRGPIDLPGDNAAAVRRAIAFDQWEQR
jgi:hypothetical protein